MERRYEVKGLTFGELVETRVALDMQIDRMEKLLDGTSDDNAQVMMAAREYWRQRIVMARQAMLLVDTAEAS